MRVRQRIGLSFGVKTDVGIAREENEDAFDVVVPEAGALWDRRGALFVVADGMGGHAAGAVASQLAVNAVAAEYYEPQYPSVEEALRSGFHRANTEILLSACGDPRRAGMGCTLVVAAVHETLTVANVGDSRAYLLHDGHVEQITEDHSLVEAQVRAGLMSREEARESPYRSAVTRCIGSRESADPDIYARELVPGDVVLLCTDGMCDALTDADIARILGESTSPTLSARQLVSSAIAGGSRDNITAVCVRIDSADDA